MPSPSLTTLAVLLGLMVSQRPGGGDLILRHCRSRLPPTTHPLPRGLRAPPTQLSAETLAASLPRPAGSGCGVIAAAPPAATQPATQPAVPRPAAAALAAAQSRPGASGRSSQRCRHGSGGSCAAASVARHRAVCAAPGHPLPLRTRAQRAAAVGRQCHAALGRRETLR